MSNNILNSYQITKMEMVKMWLTNYDFGEPLIDITDWAKFQSLDEFANRLVMSKKIEGDEYFRFYLNLDTNEENALRKYLLKKKSFVIQYILKRKSFSPYSHLYQLYLQYLSDSLNEVEKNIFLSGYIQMLENLFGVDYSEKRIYLEKKLNMK